MTTPDGEQRDHHPRPAPRERAVERVAGAQVEPLDEQHHRREARSRSTTSGMCTANDSACICRASSRYCCSPGAKALRLRRRGGSRRRSAGPIPHRGAPRRAATRRRARRRRRRPARAPRPSRRGRRRSRAAPRPSGARPRGSSTAGVTRTDASRSISVRATSANAPQPEVRARKRSSSQCSRRVGFMFPSNAERSRNSGPVAHSMNRHAASASRARVFITTDHVHRFGRRSPVGPSGGGA